MQTVIVNYFDSDKYEKDWLQFYEDKKIINSNRPISPTDWGFARYVKKVEVETEIFSVSKINEIHSAFVKLIEIDNDYLYFDIAGEYYSHINTLLIGNEFYKKYKCSEPLCNIDGYILQVNRDLVLKNLIS